MLKNHLPYLVIALLLASCSNEQSKYDGKTLADKITNFQQKSIKTSFIDSNYYYLKQAEKLLSNLKNAPDSLNAENNYLLGRYFTKKGQIDSAAVYYQNALYYVKDSISNNKQITYFYYAWDTYIILDRFGDCFATTNYFKTLVDETLEFDKMSFFYFCNENTYKRIGNFDKAIENNSLRIEMLKFSNDTLGITPALISQAELKYNSGFDKKGAFEILNKLIENENEYKDRFKRSIHITYGIFLFHEGNFRESIIHYKLGLKYAKSESIIANKKSLVSIPYANIAEVYIELKEYKLAKKYLDSVKALGLNNIPRRIQKFTLRNQLLLSSKTKSDINEVTSYLDTIYDYQDRVYADKYNEDLVALTKAIEKEKVLIAEKQVEEIKNLKLQSRLILVLISLGLLTLVGVLFIRQRKLKYEKQGLQMQQRLLRSQMNPHFTFNILYAIQNLIKENQQAATNYLLKFSRLLRLILENSIQNYIQLEKELESLKGYLDLQLLRFPNKFTYSISLNNLDGDDLIFIPPMLIQPFVENAIEHGFLGIDYLGKITITLKLQNTFIECCIEDNGKGFLEKNNENKNSTSIKLISNFLEKATKSKVSVYNKNDRNKTDTGVLVKFLIPYKLTDND